MTPSIQNIRPVFSGLLGAIAQGNRKWGGAPERLTSAGSSIAPCLFGRRDLGLHKQFQRRGQIVANSPVTLLGHSIQHKNCTRMWFARINIRTNGQTHTHTRWLWFLLFGSSLSVSLRQLLVSNRIYKRWNNLCTRLPLMLGDVPAASVISYCSYWYAPCPVQRVGG